MTKMELRQGRNKTIRAQNTDAGINLPDSMRLSFSPIEIMHANKTPVIIGNR